MTAPVSWRSVSFRRDGHPVLEGFDLELEPASTLALLGPSGSGKSTVIRLALGLSAPDAGRVEVAGRTASQDGRLLIPPEERHLSVVFQDLALWPHLTVREQLAFVLESRGVERARADERIARMLEVVGLSDKAARRPQALSGGERQRVAIARALVLEPVAVLLDEPLASLDAGLKRELIAQFRSLFAERRVAALYVTHDLREAIALGDTLAILEGGRVVQRGSAADLRREPRTAFVRRLVEELAWDGS